MLGDYDKCFKCGDKGVFRQTPKGFICEECLKEVLENGNENN